MKLTDGATREQAEYRCEYRYSYCPQVTSIRDRMHVQGMTRPVKVRPT